MAPRAASIGAKATPTTPIVRGNTTTSFPFLSLIVIFLTFPSLINSLTFLSKFSPSILKDSSFFACVFVEDFVAIFSFCILTNSPAAVNDNYIELFETVYKGIENYQIDR